MADGRVAGEGEPRASGHPSEADQPPQPPDIRRRLRFEPFHLVGLLVFAAVPALALFGVFGERWERAYARAGALELSVLYAERYRYRQISSVEVLVTNTSGRWIDTLTVAFDTAYISRFSNIMISPPPVRGYEVDLFAIEPGGTRLVVAEIQGFRYWRHRGAIIAAAGADTARVEVETLVFP